jgi:hypothetical protein
LLSPSGSSAFSERQVQCKGSLERGLLGGYQTAAKLIGPVAYDWRNFAGRVKFPQKTFTESAKVQCFHWSSNFWKS